MSDQSEQPEVPAQIKETINELIANWGPFTKIKITPIFKELEYFNKWYLRVNIRDFSFLLPWDEKITIEMVSDFYGSFFRAACYAVDDAILHGVAIGSELYKKSTIESLTKLIDTDVKRSVNNYRHNN